MAQQRVRVRGPLTDEESAKIETKRRDALLLTTVNDFKHVRFEEVIGLPTAKNTLMMTVPSPRQPQWFAGGTNYKTILLYGPPGTGKTFLAKAVATESNSTFFNIKADNIISQWQGESARNVSTIFQLARESPDGAVIFFDHMDYLCQDSSEEERQIKTQFQLEMNAVRESSTEQQLLVLGITHLPWTLDDTIRDLFQLRLYIPLPEEGARVAMFRSKFNNLTNDLTDTDFEWLGERTVGASGSDIANLFKHVCHQLAESEQFLVDSEGFYRACGKYPNCPECPPTEWSAQCPTCKALTMDICNVPPGKAKLPALTLQHFKAAIKRNGVRSLSADVTLPHVEWTNMFGGQYGT